MDGYVTWKLEERREGKEEVHTGSLNAGKRGNARRFNYVYGYNDAAHRERRKQGISRRT